MKEYVTPSEETSFYTATDTPPSEISPLQEAPSTQTEETIRVLNAINAEKDEYAKRRRETIANLQNSQPASILPFPSESEDHQKLLEKWRKDSIENQELHEMSRSYFRIWGDVVSAFAITFSGISGISNIATAQVDDEKARLGINITFGLLSIFASILMNLYRQLKFQDLEREHNFYATEYCKLIGEIDMHLTIHGTSQRVYANISEFVKYCQKQIMSIKDREPPIRRHIYGKYLAQAKNSTPPNQYLKTLNLVRPF